MGRVTSLRPLPPPYLKVTKNPGLRTHFLERDSLLGLVSSVARDCLETNGVKWIDRDHPSRNQSSLASPCVSHRILTVNIITRSQVREAGNAEAVLTSWKKRAQIRVSHDRGRGWLSDRERVQVFVERQPAEFVSRDTSALIHRVRGLDSKSGAATGIYTSRVYRPSVVGYQSTSWTVDACSAVD